MIEAINVYNGLFARQGLRAGDLLAACNFLEYIRKNQNIPNMRLYIPDSSVYPQEHCFQMRDFLIANTDYISLYPDKLLELRVIPGTDPTYSDMYNLWNIRKDVLHRRQNVFDIPDAIKIPNKKEWVDKVVICPLMDAAYNHERNWSLEYTQSILDINNYRSYNEVIIIAKEPIVGLNIRNFKYCHDYAQSMEHIMECHTYIGGDTGLSHFAAALEPGPFGIFHYSSHTYGTTCPLNFKKNGTMIYY